MIAKERRDEILRLLMEHPPKEPLNATVLSQKFGVSRQIIVGDIALLRSAGYPIVSTARGYYYRPEHDRRGTRYRIVCSHSTEQMEEELNTVVDFGGKVEDVTVEHPIYGKLSAELKLGCRYDVEQFCAKIAASDAKPLSALTEGVHVHTVLFEDEDAYARFCKRLTETGILLSCD